jgi:shikimate kinase
MGTLAIDLDDRTASVLGHKAAGDALRAVGIDAFRAAEVVALRGVITGPPCVLALGGGTPTAPGAAELLGSLRRPAPPRLIYLRASPATLAARIERDPTDRPPLTALTPLEEIQMLFASRDPLYASLADFVIDVDGRSEAALVDELSSLARP